MPKMKTKNLFVLSGILKKESDTSYMEINSEKSSEVMRANIWMFGGPKIEIKIKNIDRRKLISLKFDNWNNIKYGIKKKNAKVDGQKYMLLYVDVII